MEYVDETTCSADGSAAKIATPAKKAVHRV
jgi:hypothetical protein